MYVLKSSRLSAVFFEWWARVCSRLAVGNVSIDGVQSSFMVSLEQYFHYNILHTVFEIKHAVLARRVSTTSESTMCNYSLVHKA